MTRRTQRRSVASARRATQLAFLLLFVALVVVARPTPGRPEAPWLTLFLGLDPLLLLTVLLAGHALPLTLLAALLTVGVTLLLGRVFCGWFCPLGTLHAAAGRLLGRRRRAVRHWTRWNLAKYYVLGAVLVMALGGAAWLALLDPIALLYRTTATLLLPAAQSAIEGASAAVYQADPGFGPWRITALTEPAYRFLRDHVFVTPHQAFEGGALILGFFLATLALNALQPRFWCRYICPLGALLGLLAWRPWFRRRVVAAQCNACDLCGLRCHGAATDSPASGWKPQECLGCMSCTECCTRDAVRFEFAPPWNRSAAGDRINLSRRGLVGSAAAGLVGLVTLRVSPQARGNTFNPDLIRPPGARAETDFLARCVACGVCMKVCPTGGLQPALSEAGLAGLWTPRLVPRIGYCDYSCTACGDACPTQAIQRLPLARKQTTHIGLATIDVARCLPYASGLDCIVCEEHCPVPEKAIFFDTVAIVSRDGQPRTVKRPRVDPQRCIGCGICERVCPFKDRAAIRVSSAGESRHPDNQPILGQYPQDGGP